MPTVRIDRHHKVTVLTLDAPPVNAIDVALLEDLEAALREVADSSAVVITGAGRAFSAGVDLTQLLDGGEAYAHRLLTTMTSSFTTLYDFPRPVVAAINGHAIAGGCALSLATDRRLAAGGLIGLNELSIGLPFPPAVLQIVRAALAGNAERVVFDADLYQVDAAREVQLVDQVVAPAELMDSAFLRAERLARIPATTFKRTKETFRPQAGSARGNGSLGVIEQLAAEWTSPEMIARVTKVLKK